MLTKLTAAGVAMALGTGCALGVGACGEKRGSVQFQGDTGTGTAKTGATEAPKTATSP